MTRSSIDVRAPIGRSEPPDDPGGRPGVAAGVGGVDDDLVLVCPRRAGQRERAAQVAGVQQQQVRVVDDHLAAAVAVPQPASVQVHADRAQARRRTSRRRPARGRPDGTRRGPCSRRRRRPGCPRRTPAGAAPVPRGAARATAAPGRAGRPPRSRSSSPARRSRCPARTRCCCRCCVRQRSSPATSIGAPVESSRVVSRLRACRSRNVDDRRRARGRPRRRSCSERLSSVPSRLSSPFASLCLRS